MTGLGKFRAALLEDTLAVTCGQPLDGFDQSRQRGLTVGGDRKIDLRQAAEILVIRFDIKIAGRDCSQFGARFSKLSRRAMHLVSQRVHCRPEIGNLQAGHHVGFSDGSPSALRVIEGMHRGKVHPPALIDDGRLQRLGEFNEQRHRSRRPGQPVNDQDWILSANEKPRKLRHGTHFTLRRRRYGQLRNR